MAQKYFDFSVVYCTVRSQCALQSSALAGLKSTLRSVEDRHDQEGRLNVAPIFILIFCNVWLFAGFLLGSQFPLCFDMSHSNRTYLGEFNWKCVIQVALCGAYVVPANITQPWTATMFVCWFRVTCLIVFTDGDATEYGMVDKNLVTDLLTAQLNFIRTKIFKIITTFLKVWCWKGAYFLFFILLKRIYAHRLYWVRFTLLWFVVLSGIVGLLMFLIKFKMKITAITVILSCVSISS